MRRRRGFQQDDDTLIPPLILAVAVLLCVLGILWPEDGWKAIGLFGSGFLLLICAGHLMGAWPGDSEDGPG